MKGHPITYSAEELAWLEANRDQSIGDYHRGFVAAFARADVALANLHSLRKRLGWKTGRTGQFVKGQVAFNKGKPHPAGRAAASAAHHFKKGQLPHNTKFLGHERVSKDGYVEISVAEINPHTGYDRRYVLKHRHLWEQLHGPVPEGMALKCRGDKTDCDPSNWELVPRAMLPRLNGRFGRGYDQAPAELKPTIMAVAKLEHQLREKRGGAR